MQQEDIAQAWGRYRQLYSKYNCLSGCSGQFKEKRSVKLESMSVDYSTEGELQESEIP